MPNSFEFIGKIQAIKETEKFKPIERRDFTSGWTQTTVKFNCISGTNRIMCMTQGGKWKDDKKNSVIKTFSKSMTDEDGNVIKGERIDIPWDKRFDEDEINKVAGFRRFVVDTDYDDRRRSLNILIKAFKNGAETDEQMEIAGCSTLEDATAELEKSLKKRRVFLTEWDFAEHMTKVLASDKFKNNLFKISGNQEIQYSEAKGRFYVNYKVNKVELVPEDTTLQTEMRVDFYFGDGCIDDSGFEDTGKAILNGFTDYYDNSIKERGFMPISIVVRDQKYLNSMNRKLKADDDEIKNIWFVVSVINGAKMTAITYDDLDDDTKADIDDGLLTFEDVVAELGGNKAGDTINELRLKALNARKKDPENTAYSIEDMVVAKLKETVEDKSEDVDIFEDEDL